MSQTATNSCRFLFWILPWIGRNTWLPIGLFREASYDFDRQMQRNSDQKSTRRIDPLHLPGSSQGEAPQRARPHIAGLLLRLRSNGLNRQYFCYSTLWKFQFDALVAGNDVVQSKKHIHFTKGQNFLALEKVSYLANWLRSKVKLKCLFRVSSIAGAILMLCIRRGN